MADTEPNDNAFSNANSHSDSTLSPDGDASGPRVKDGPGREWLCTSDFAYFKLQPLQQKPTASLPLNLISTLWASTGHFSPSQVWLWRMLHPRAAGHWISRCSSIKKTIYIPPSFYHHMLNKSPVFKIKLKMSTLLDNYPFNWFSVNMR